METDTLVKILWALVGVLGSGVLGLFIWAIQRHISATSQNTLTLAVLASKVDTLTQEISHLRDAYHRLGKLETDVNRAYQRIEIIESSVSGA